MKKFFLRQKVKWKSFLITVNAIMFPHESIKNSEYTIALEFSWLGKEEIYKGFIAASHDDGRGNIPWIHFYVSFWIACITLKIRRERTDDY